MQSTSAAVISSPSAESTVQSSSQQQHNTTTSTPSPKAGIQKFTVITVSGMEKKWAEQRYRMITIIKVRLLGTRRHSESGAVPGTVPDLPGDGDAPPSPIPIGGSAPCANSLEG